jgi:hypothetical protein
MKTLKAVNRMEIMGQVVAVGGVEALGGLVLVGLKGRTQMVKAVRPPEKAKRELEERPVATTGLGIVNPVKRVVSRSLFRSSYLSDHNVI